MTEPISIPCPSALMRSIEANLHGYIACVHRRQPSMVLWDLPTYLLADSGLPSDTFNKVARARIAPERSCEDISRAAEYFRGVARPFTWWVGPSSRPLDIQERLQALGFCVAERETGMSVELRELKEAPLPAGLAVQRVTASQHLEDFCSVLAENWVPPDPSVACFYQTAAPWMLETDSPLRHFVAYLDGEPAGVSSLYLEGGVGGIYSVASRRALRGRGIGSRLTWAAADEARRAGAALAVLQASSQGKTIYERLGFRGCCGFAEYTPAGQ
jgi:GNAT superfamily N-acetyltransferase